MNITIKNIISLALLVLLLFLFWYLRTLVAYMLISVVLSIIGRPIVDLLHKIRLKKWQLSYASCAAISLLLMISVILSVFLLFTPLVLEQARIISNMNSSAFVQHLSGSMQSVKDFIAHYRLTNDVPIEMFLKMKVDEILKAVDIPIFLSSLIGVLGNVFVACVSISFMTFFFLKDRDLFIRMVLSVTPDNYLFEVKDVMRNTVVMLRRYFLGLIIDIVIISSLVSIGMFALGVKNALLIGVFAGIMTIIPYVGPLIGYLLALFIAFTTNFNLAFSDSLLPLLMKVTFVFFGVRMLDDMVFQPYIFSNSVKAHPLEIFIVIMAAATIGGIVGMIIAVPTYTFLRIIAKEFFSKSKLVKALTKNL